jgi:hypothetical protein
MHDAGTVVKRDGEGIKKHGKDRTAGKGITVREGSGNG